MPGSVAVVREIHVERTAGPLELRPFGAERLTRGFVESGGETGAGVYARSRCVLEGARPNERYEVTLLVHPFDPTCSNVPARFASAPVVTDHAGDGRAELVIRSEDVPPAVRRASHGLRWIVVRGGRPVYQTDCTTVTLDASSPRVIRGTGGTARAIGET